MDQATDPPLKKTPLNARHRASGARMVPYGGWDMPVEYSGISPSTWRCATRAGLFDVSHMGEIEIAGKDALAAVSGSRRNDACEAAGRPGAILRAADAGRARSSTTCSSTGWRPQHFLLVVNAVNIAKDYALDRGAASSRRATPSRSTPARATRCSRCRVRRRWRSCSR